MTTLTNIKNTPVIQTEYINTSSKNISSKQS